MTQVNLSTKADHSFYSNTAEQDTTEHDTIHLYSRAILQPDLSLRWEKTTQSLLHSSISTGQTQPERFTASNHHCCSTPAIHSNSHLIAILKTHVLNLKQLHRNLRHFNL
ncbi:hypothetical protein Droror1_Dr00027934 [Drosera rotundifolia]